MAQIEVWLHPLFSGSVTVDPAKSGVLLATALARREDTQSRKVTAQRRELPSLMWFYCNAIWLKALGV